LVENKNLSLKTWLQSKVRRKTSSIRFEDCAAPGAA
jgi:hypothetical protein